MTGTNWGEMAAIAMLTLLPALVFLGLVQRHIVAGLTFGALRIERPCTSLTTAEPARARASCRSRPTRFDRVFISVVVFVAMHLFWMRFLEAIFRSTSRRRSRSASAI